MGAGVTIAGCRVAPRRRTGGGVPGVADGEVAVEAGQRAVVEPAATRPMSFTTVASSPSLTAMPADSWPRCCSAKSPR